MNLFAAPAFLSAAYHGFSLFAAIRKSREPAPERTFAPPVSILKPVGGADESFVAAITSHVVQDYPEYEILFGISDPNDPARANIERLRQDHPRIPIRLFHISTDAANRKAGLLEALSARARHPFLVVNDGDIRVRPDYLREVIAPLKDEGVALVTCLYRGAGGSFPARSEALGIATEFAPSVLVARQIGVNEFAMGSTLAFRARDLTRIGGFGSIRDYLADDYQLGKRLTGLGMRVVLGRPVVETWLGRGSWRDVWMHQVRWARTIRVSRPGGYFGYAITHAVFWSLLAWAAGNPAAALACYLFRILVALFITARVMQDAPSLRLFWWLPARDLLGFIVWLAGLWGSRVEWRGQILTIDKTGKIRPVG